MRSVLRRGALVVLGGAAAGVVAVSVAWACSPQAAISVSPGSGVAGRQVTVSGTAFTTAPVRVHWGSATGPVLGTAVGPSFSVAVTIPQSAPDVYYLVAVGPEGRGSAPFRVEAPAGAGGGQQTPGGGGQQTPGGGGGQETPGGGGQQTPGGGEGTGGGGSTGGGEGAGGGGSTGGGSTTTPGGGSAGGGADFGNATTDGGSSRGRANSQADGGTGVKVRARSVRPNPTGSQVTAGVAAGGAAVGAVRTRTGQRVFAASLPTTRPGAASRARESDSAGAAQREQGFAVKERSSLTMPEGSGPALGPEAGLGSRLAIGASILALGLVLLMGGFMVAVVRRRRAESEV